MARRTFVEVSKKNELGSNLTELNVTSDLVTGFMDHPDWMAHTARYAAILKWTIKHRVREMLDVGCGRMSTLTFMWRNRFPMEDFNYTGLDLRATKNWLEPTGQSMQLPQKANIHLVRMDLVKDDPELIYPHSFVVCMEVLEHVPRELAQELVNRLYYWTRPGGTLFFSSPNAGVSNSTAENHVGPDGVSREWTYGDKIAMLRKAGFTVDHCFGTSVMVKNIPDEFWNRPEVIAMYEMWPGNLFKAFVAAYYPEVSNNALMICSRPE